MRAQPSARHEREGKQGQVRQDRGARLDDFLPIGLFLLLLAVAFSLLTLVFSGCSGFRGVTWAATPYGQYRMPESGGASNEAVFGLSVTIWERGQAAPTPAVPSSFAVKQDVNVTGAGGVASASATAAQSQEQEQEQAQAGRAHPGLGPRR